MPFPVELRQWATRHHVGDDALAELAAILGNVRPGETNGGESESNVQSRVRLAAPAAGFKLWRNNVGVLQNAQGVPVRYGLANDTPKLNERLKSGDLIGWRRVLIVPEMVGATIAQFTSIECKWAGWSPARPTNVRDFAHEQAQANWAALVAAEGGYARFVTAPEQLGV